MEDVTGESVLCTGVIGDTVGRLDLLYWSGDARGGKAGLGDHVFDTRQRSEITRRGSVIAEGGYRVRLRNLFILTHIN